MPEPEFEAHPAFKDAGQREGLEIWRIEQFEPVLQESKTCGSFYKGDAYIILHTKQRSGANKYDYNLHFWLGGNCSQDEAGTAAIRTVELDETVAGGGAVQYREVQGHESKIFLSYFKQGIKYLEGGVDSGFKKIGDIEHAKRLYQLKGTTSVRVEEVQCNCGSLNQSDVFILDDDKNIYTWIGPKSHKMTMLKAVDISRRIRDDDKGGKAHIHIVESDWNSNEAFFKALGSKDKEIKATDTAKSDEDIVRKLDQDLVLYRISGTDESNYDIEEVASRPLERKSLESENCYVMDSGYSGLYVWTGKKCSVDFKKKVWKGVNEFITNHGYPSWLTVTRVVDGGESPLFKQYFQDWLDEDSIPKPVDPGDGSNVAKQDDREYDATEMHKRAQKTLDAMPDDGSGIVKVWRVENFGLKEVPEYAYGAFFGGDCYVILYTYENNGKTQYIIYFWQGLRCSIEDRGTSALQAIRIDDELGGEAVQIRVVMNKEPAHFLKIFKGRMLVFLGGSVNGFRNVHDHDTYDPTSTVMFHIRGDDLDHTRCIQVDGRGNSLNSNDVFIVESPTQNKVYVWVGTGAKEAECNMAKELMQYVSPDRGDPVVVEEGKETKKFWDAIGGEEPYYTGPKKKDGVRAPPRLFHCTNSSGRFTAEEIVAFDQEDLDETSCMILDTFDEIFVWIGADANEIEKKESMKTAYNYLNTDPTGRTPDNTLIVVVRQSFEPPQFTGQFQAWDIEKWSGGKSFDELIREVGEENAGIGTLEDEAKKYFATHPLDILQRRIPPEGVDVTNKEMYLTDEDFVEVFGMSKDEYREMPEWKRVNAKKQAGLF